MRKIVVWIGAALLALLGLILVGILVHWAWGEAAFELIRIGPMLPAALGLVAIASLNHWIAGGPPIDLWIALIVALAAYAALYRICSMSLGHGAPWAAVVFSTAAFVILLPFAVAGHGRAGGPKIRAQAPIPGRIDLVLVEPGPLSGVGSRPGAPPGDLAQWDVRYTVARPSASGEGLDVLLAGTESRGEALRALRTGRSPEPGAGRVEWRPGAQRAAVLFPSAPVADDPLAATVVSLGVPGFALLSGDASGSLAGWTAWARQHGGDAGTTRELEGPSPVDSALRLVATSREALSDRQLAYAYRPLLFFDKRELFDWPVDVDAAFAEGAVEMCRRGTLTGDDCEDVGRASDLDQSFDYLRVEPGRFSAADRERERHVAGSAYYYHAVDGERGRTYLDYWWYLPYNPSLSGWMCSPGFSLPEFDCFDHESDWEGVTVEIGPEEGPPRAVYYAQHAHVVRHGWGELVAGWRELPQMKMVKAVGAYHPLVFVARASHASYRNPCQTHACLEYGSVLPEGNHDGRSRWPDDEDSLCAGRCLKPLPVTRDGRRATWNAFSGPWGSQACILRNTFCNRAEAPRAPSFQSRYEEPGVPR